VTPRLVKSVAVANTLGEGVLWHADRKTVWWTDIERSALFEFDPQRDQLQSWQTPYRVASFGFVADSDALVVAFDRGIAIFEPDTGAIRWLVPPGVLAEGLRFNDGKVDARGRFWVGTMVEDAAIAALSGALYCVDGDGTLSEHGSGIAISNGLCWSPDNRTLYHADSPTRLIRAIQFDVDNGILGDAVPFARAETGNYPDGATVDSDGGVWSAQWGGSRVVRFAAGGQASQWIDLPVTQPTCAAFGGERFDTLFVTSARAGLSEDELAAQPEAGDLFIYETDRTGLPAHRFRLGR